MSQPFFQVNCRRVHSEILESVSKIKCSILGRKGGLLYSYGHFGSEAAINESGKESKRGRKGNITITIRLSTDLIAISGGHGGSSGHGKPSSSADTSPTKAGPGGKTGRGRNKSNAITVSLPSPAGNRLHYMYSKIIKVSVGRPS